MIGSIIELKNKTIVDYVRSISLMYTKPNSGEFILDYASEVIMFLSSYLKLASRPKGKIVASGARDKDCKYYIVNLKNELGSAKSLAIKDTEFKVLTKKKRKKKNG